MANQYRSVLASSGPAPTGGNALPAEVLSGKTFTNDNGEQTGTMPNRGAVSQTIAAGGSYTIPEGYHNGNGVVSADVLPSKYLTFRIGSTANITAVYNNGSGDLREGRAITATAFTDSDLVSVAYTSPNIVVTAKIKCRIIGTAGSTVHNVIKNVGETLSFAYDQESVFMVVPV